MPRLSTTAQVALRALAMALAALSVGHGETMTPGLVGLIAGAVTGTLVGDLVAARTRLRTPLLIALCLGLTLASFQLVSLSLSADLPAARLGTKTLLSAASATRLFTLAAGTTGLLRVIGARIPPAAVLELFAVAAAVPVAFAAHRNGVIARPLWLTDWVWQRGLDPAHVLLAVGGASAAILGALLLAQAKRGRAASSAMLVLALCAAAVLFIRAVGPPQPQPPGLLGSASSSASGTPAQSQPDGGHADAGADALIDGEVPASPDAGTDGPVAYGQGDGDTDAGGSASDGGAPPDAGGDAASDAATAASEQLDKAQSGGGKATPVAVVIFDDDYTSPSEHDYFRQDAWSQFNGTRLVRAAASGIDSDIPGHFPAVVTEVEDPPPPDVRTRVRGQVALLVDHERPFALESPIRFAPHPNPNPARFRRAYRFESLAQKAPYPQLFGRRAGNPAWPDATRKHYLEAPTDPRYRKLAETILETLPPKRRNDPFARAVAIKLHLDEEFKYSLKHRHNGAADPTADFLFGDHIGYCVHFAHAAVFLWRTLGIPSRVGTGYHASEEARHGGSTVLIRSGDAHAWPELYLEGAGWIVLDIAPKTVLDQPGEPQDDELQRLLGEMARGLPPEPSEEPGKEPFDWKGLARAARDALALTLAAAAIALYSLKLYRRLRPYLARERALPRVAYRAALDRLTEAGLSRAHAESREAFAARCSALPSFTRLTSMHLEARLGAPSHPPPRDAWLEALSSLARELPRQTPWWRRLLGLLDPTSPLRSR